MSEILVLGFSFILLATGWLMASWGGASGQRVGAWAASLAAPLLAMLTLLVTAGNFGDVRVAVEGLEAQLEQPTDEVRIGGSSEDDHLVVRDLPGGFVKLQAIHGRLTATLSSASAAPSERPASASPALSADDWQSRVPVAAVEIDGQLFNSAAVRDGTELGIAGGSAARFREDDLRFERDGMAGPEIAGRRARLFGDWTIPIGRELGPSVQIFPVRYFAAPQEYSPVTTPNGAPIGAFFYRHGSLFGEGGYLRRALRIALTEPGITVDSGDGKPVKFQPELLALEDGQSKHVSLYRVDIRRTEVEEARPAYLSRLLDRVASWVPLLRQRDEEQELVNLSRIQERRSFRIWWNSGRLGIVFDTPYYIRLSRKDLERRQPGDEAARIRVVGRRQLRVIEDDEAMLLHLPVFGDPMETELLGVLKLADGHLDAVTHEGLRRYPAGSAFSLGERTSAIVRVTRLGPPLGAITVIGAIGLVAILAGLGLREKPVALVILSGVEFFLAVRMLIGYQGAYLDPESAQGAWRSLLAWVWVPFCLQTIWLSYAGLLRASTALHALTVVLATALISWATGGNWIAAAIAGLVMASAAWPLGRFGLRYLDRFVDRLPGWNSPFRSDRHWPWIGAAFVTVVVLRGVGIVLLGWKERIDIGGQFAVSILFTPATLLLFAWIWSLRTHRHWKWVVFFYVMAAGAIYGLIPLAARDFGAMLIYSIPVILLFATSFSEARSWRSFCFALPLALLALVHLAALVYPILSARSEITQQAALADESEAVELLESKVNLRNNTLRLWGWSAPEALQGVGTTRSDSLGIVMGTLDAYASRGAAGEGYVNFPVAPALLQTHLNDNVSAVHVMAPFGWLGGAALLGTLTFLALLVWVLPERRSGLPPRFAFGVLLVWTIAVAGLYMFSANVGLMMFTGKNVYFLAASSLSDAAEGGLLSVLALWALAPAPAGVRP